MQAWSWRAVLMKRKRSPGYHTKASRICRLRCRYLVKSKRDKTVYKYFSYFEKLEGFIFFKRWISFTGSAHVFDTYFSVKIRKSKTERTNHHGDSIVMSKGTIATSPYMMTKGHINVANLSSEVDTFLFKPVFRSKHIWISIFKNRPLIYSGVREMSSNLFKRSIKRHDHRCAFASCGRSHRGCKLWRGWPLLEA